MEIEIYIFSLPQTYEGERNEQKQRHGKGKAILPQGDIYDVRTMKYPSWLFYIRMDILISILPRIIVLELRTHRDITKTERGMGRGSIPLEMGQCMRETTQIIRNME